ncbi:LIC20153 family lipoprotein [Leptospira neocaledonica]|uniref:Uncharacterized protein n=1 Tax=Leptospira neocaledonica TaxID=2023192 RepID=A0A2M9ZUD3_9LEPT|nr:hypothetical protein [Leptospira neocaledonica]PJZ75645.1 hypothetical protein CH365_18055 [Leptospira neocaledonica]
MKQKAIWLLLALLLSASLVNCKEDDGGDLTNLALLNSLGGGGDCLVAFPGKAAVGVNRTRATKGGGPIPIVWGSVPFVNHPMAIVEVKNAVDNDTVVFTNINVAELNAGEPVAYTNGTNDYDCPLAEDEVIDADTAFDPSGGGPYTWTNNSAPGTYYFLLYIVGTSHPSNATVEYN